MESHGNVGIDDVILLLRCAASANPNFGRCDCSGSSSSAQSSTTVPVPHTPARGETTQVPTNVLRLAVDAVSGRIWTLAHLEVPMDVRTLVWF